jgi:hypothetical protein
MNPHVRRLTASAALTLLAACGNGPPQSTASSTDVAVPPLQACNLPPDSIRLLVVLDHSGSMLPHWSGVQTSLPQMISALPDGSWFSMQLFSARSVNQIPDVQLNASTRPVLMQQLRTLAAPAPNAPTDIGRGMLGAAISIDEAAKQRRGPLTFLFVVSDGRHEPPSDSPYPDRTTFRPLTHLFAGLNAAVGIRRLDYAVPIGAGGVEGVDDVRIILPDAQALVPMAPTQIGSAVRGEIAAAMANLILAQAAPEIASPRLNATLSNQPQPIAYLGSTHSVAGVRSAAACITYRFAGGIDGDSTAVMLAPGDSAVVPLRLRSELSILGALPWKAPSVEELDTTTARATRLSGTLAFAPAVELINAGVDTTHQEFSLSVAGTILHLPMTWVTFLTPVAFAMVLLLSAGLYYGRPARLWGTVRLKKENNETDEANATDLGELGSGSHDMQLANGARLRFRARKRNPIGLDGYQAHVYLEVVEAATVEVRGEDEIRTATRGGRVLLSPECTIRVVSGKGAEPTTLTWN